MAGDEQQGIIGNIAIYSHNDFTIGAVAGDGDDIDNIAYYMITTPTNTNDTISGFIPLISLSGQTIWIINKSATKNIVVKHNATSTAGNRIFTQTGADVTLVPLATMQLMYMDSGSVGWWQI